MSTRIQGRRDTAANWASVNPILAQGEFGIELTTGGAPTGVVKIGDGVTAWASLPNIHASSGITTVPAGNLAATNVQASLAELDAEKLPAIDTPNRTQISTAGGGLGAGWVFIAVSGNADQGFWVQNVTPGTTATSYVQAANNNRTAAIALVATSSGFTPNGISGPSKSFVEADVSELLIITTSANDIVFATGASWNTNERLRIVNSSGKLRLGGDSVATLYRASAGVVATDANFSAPSVSIGTNPATVGAVRLPNAQAVYSRNAGNSGDFQLLALNASNVVMLSGDGLSVSIPAPLKVLPGAFAAADKYLVVDAAGNVHVSTLGPAS